MIVLGEVMVPGEIKRLVGGGTSPAEELGMMFDGTLEAMHIHIHRYIDLHT